MTPIANGGKTNAQNGMQVAWTSDLGAVRFTLASPREIANFNDGKYLRYLSPVAMTSDFAGEQFSRHLERDLGDQRFLGHDPI